MNNENDTPSYDFDGMDRKPSYPCDAVEGAEEKRAYPCDLPEEKASYPCDDIGAAEGARPYPCDTADKQPEKPKGKGRRGGNAALSRVIHSGVFERTGKKQPEAKRPAYDRTKERRGADRGFKSKSPESIYGRAYMVRIEDTSDVGAFVKAPDEVLFSELGSKVQNSGEVLLPFSEQIGRPKTGEMVTVHFYDDKGGRLACTMRTPYLKEGEVGILKVAQVTRIGAFLDNGVPKQVLLPFKEQIKTPSEGDEVLVWLYTDKSGRQAASMRVYGHLSKNSPYKEDDRVKGFVYEINPKLGIFVAVDNKYYGLVPLNETFKEYSYGDELEARVAKVREDGKLDLLVRDKLYKTVNEDADVILYELKRNNGFLPYGDRADAEFIEETYAMSKNQFKRALGHLYKNHIVDIDRKNDTVRLILSE